MPISYWPDDYIEKKKSAEDAIKMLPSGRRIFIGSSCGEPQYLVKTLVENATRFSDLEIVRLLSLESSPISLAAKEDKGHHFNIRNIYQGAAETRSLSDLKPFITPMNLSAVPDLFKKGQLPIHAALIQVTPPDDFGWMSLGISVDVCLAAVHAANLVIAQVNPNMPRTMGHSFIHVNDIDVFVEKEEDLLTVGSVPEIQAAITMAKIVAPFIDDGSTLQLGLGASPQSILLALSNKNDLGIHTQFIFDGIMDLVALGVVNNRKKGVNEGKIVASNAIGSAYFYEFLHNNPSIEFHPSDYVNNPSVIAQHNQMIAINMAREIDLTGQIAADAFALNHFSGVTGMVDFMRGAAMSRNGKAIILLPSVRQNGTSSRIVPQLHSPSVVVPRADVYYVVSEYGAVNLYGKNLQDRAIAMISIAHPDHRDQLFEKAVEIGYITRHRSLNEASHGVYPVHMEETVKIENQDIRFRPAKPVDERRIQEHFYDLDKESVVARFFHQKTSFFRDDVENMFQLDYIKNMTIVAITGDFGFGKIIGVGMYAMEPNRNVAEVAFSVSKEFQGKGLASVILQKLVDAARENGIAGLVAYTAPSNKGMIKLFKKVHYNVKTSFEDDMLMLECFFEDFHSG
ncbi:MAG: acetyl-CoA hydrolase/transferase [Candidatus Magnetoglobus multicellularis str. Araruama]|uniref:Acetyl-CoA hydrolase/transferase n=1 Tax=Candidatus Magnetoglobus multicellularis str. Araruama TaxID=890399 RepID=A0A1V1P3H4_9BACT|nr:MAG: acetyl-CoA hydrolase/transferase [Candidatus Magnetoglobus multicellularis str. Araruama]